jgi:peptide/nickel transport system substrate-binding protein
MTATIARAIERRPFIKLTAGALAAAVVGCRPGETAATRRSTLIIACPWGEDELDGLTSVGLKYLVYLPLLTENDRGELEGRLADRWEHSPDQKEWTFHLRMDVRWHDGVPVTAHDVKFTLELLSHPDVLELGPHAVESIAVLDDVTIRVRFENWSASRPIVEGYDVVLPKHLLAHLATKTYAAWDFWTRPVGNGPYRFAHYVRQTMMQFDANPDYYRGRPRIEHVVLKFAQGAATTELLSGNVDVLLEAGPKPPASDAAWRAYYGLAGGRMWGGQIFAILWNNAHPRLRDARVRRALTLAINRRELARVLNLPDSFPILDGPFTSRQVRRGELPEPLPYDPAQARALFDAAGWWQRGGDGLRERDGQLFRITLLVGTEPGFSQVAVYVQEALRRCAVGMDIQTLNSAVIGKRVREGQFDASLMYVPGPSEYWRRWFGEHSPLGYRNAQVVRLLERLPLAIDPAEEDGIRRQLTQVFRAEAPATFLFPRELTVLARERVRGLSSPWRVDPIRFIDALWLDDRGSG